MNKYQSTLLAQDSTKEEIQKADLDLLSKINSVIDGMHTGSSTGLDAEVNTLKAEIIPVSDISRLTEISGDGLSTQYLHDKSGNVIWTNNGLTAVDGYRGKGLLCNGSRYAVANSPVIGTTGTIAIKFSITTLSVVSIVCATSIYHVSGWVLYVETNGQLALNTQSLGNNSVNYLGLITINTLTEVIINFISLSTIEVILNGISTTINLTTPYVYSLAENMFVGSVFGLSAYMQGTIYNFKAWSRILSDDECISWANDPAGMDSNVAGIIESGSNANGRWEKYSNGKLLQWGKVTTVANVRTNITMPVSAIGGYGEGWAWGNVIPYGGNGTMNVFFIGTTQLQYDTNVAGNNLMWMFQGRWF
jgi:hypothetical protein